MIQNEKIPHVVDPKKSNWKVHATVLRTSEYGKRGLIVKEIQLSHKSTMQASKPRALLSALKKLQQFVQEWPYLA